MPSKRRAFVPSSIDLDPGGTHQLQVTSTVYWDESERTSFIWRRWRTRLGTTKGLTGPRLPL